MLVQDAGLAVEQRGVAAARAAGDGLAHLADHVVVDQRKDFRPELRLGDMGVDVDQEIILVAFRLPGGMREDVARVGLIVISSSSRKALGDRSSMDGVSRIGRRAMAPACCGNVHLRAIKRQGGQPQIWAHC